MEKAGKKRSAKKKTAIVSTGPNGVKLSVSDNEFLGSVLPPDFVFTPGISHRGYKPEFDQKLIAHMAKGYSYDSFAGVLCVELAALFQWEKTFPSFAEAKRVGRSQARLWWERLAVTHVAAELVRNPKTGKLQQPRFLNFHLWAFNMSNRFGWQAPTAEGSRREEDEATLSPGDRKIMSPDDWLQEVRKRRAEESPKAEDAELVPARPGLPGPKLEKSH